MEQDEHGGSRALRSIFPTARSLEAYVQSVSSVELVRDGDEEGYSNFCRGVKVVPETSPPVFGAAIQRTGEEVSIKECINTVIAQSVRNHSGEHWRRKNSLALGYKSIADNWGGGNRGASVKGFPEIQSHHANTIHMIYSHQDMHWQEVANRMGESLFRHLLSLPLFVPTSYVQGGGNGSYIQVAGTPVSEFLHNPTTAASAVRARVFTSKRKDLIKSMTSNSGRTVSKEALDLVQVRGRTQLPRYAIFYKYFGERSNVLSTQHLLHKTATTSALLASHSFGLVKSLARTKGKTALTDESDLGRGVRQCLLALTEAVLGNYRRLNVARMLHLHCPQLPAQRRSAKVDAEGGTEAEGEGEGDDSTLSLSGAGTTLTRTADSIYDASPAPASAPAPAPGSKRKGSARGCRAGRAHQQKRQRNLPVDAATKPPPTLAAGAAAGGEMPSTKPKRKRRRKKKVRTSTVSVGERLLSRILAGAEAVASLRDDGIHSQEQGAAAKPFPSPSSNFPSPSRAALMELAEEEEKEEEEEEEEEEEDEEDEDSISSSMQAEPRDCESQSLHSLSLELLNEHHWSFPNDDEEDDEDEDDNDDIEARRAKRGRHVESEQQEQAQAQGQGETSSAQTGASRSLPSLALSSSMQHDGGLAQHLMRALPTEASVEEDGGSSGTLGGLENAAPPSGGAGEGAVAGADDNFSLSVPVARVSAFVCSVVRRTLPLELWGSRRNLNALLSSVDRYVRLGQHETLTVEQLTQRMSPADIPWLAEVALLLREAQSDAGTECDSDDEGSGDTIGNNRAPLPPQHGVTLLLHAFLYWVVSDVVNPLLSCCFYCTEAEGRGSGAAAEVLFYHKGVWSELVRRGEAQMAKQFMKVVPTDAPSAHNPAAVKQFRQRKMQRCLALPSIRFMPKATSLRPIANLRGKLFSSLEDRRRGPAGTADGHVVSNKVLHSTLSVLTRIANASPLLMGFGLNSMSHAYARMRRFREVLSAASAAAAAGEASAASGGQQQPKFYMAVCDLEKCFDNVKTTLLYDLVGELLDGASGAEEREGGFVLHKYTVTHYQASLEKPFTKKIKLVTSHGERHTLQEAVPAFSRSFRRSVIADQVVYETLFKADVLRVVKTHLFNHVVTLPLHEGDGSKKVFTQVTGIPQGSVLSPLLCNLYYGHAERKIFGSDQGQEVQLLGLRDKTLVMRWMDDYLVISTEQRCVQHFLQRAHQAFTPFGGGINTAKTRVNFDCEVELEGRKMALRRIPDGHGVEWCGLLIDPSTLEVRINFWKKLLDFPLSASGSRVEPGGHSLRRVMKTYVRMKANAIVLDAALNSRDTVLCTIYQMFLVAAMRTHCLIKKMGAGNVTSTVQRNTEYLVRCIEEAVLFGARLFHSRTSKRQSRVLRFGGLALDGKEKENGNGNGNDGGVVEDDGGNGYASNGDDDDDDICGNSSLDLNSEFMRCLLDSNSKVDATVGSCEVDHKTAIWLGLSAFFAALSCRQGVYHNVLHRIRGKLAGLEKVLSHEHLAAARLVIAPCNAILGQAVWK